MKNILIILSLLTFNTFASLGNSSADIIIGEWNSQEKDGKITIFKQGDRFYGRVTWGKIPGKKDIKNPDPKLRARDLIGSVILQNFTFTGSSWENGTIYDPNSGKTYDCILTLKNNNKILDIRGYVGTPMFGRTSSWTRS